MKPTGPEETTSISTSDIRAEDAARFFYMPGPPPAGPHAGLFAAARRELEAGRIDLAGGPTLAEPAPAPVGVARPAAVPGYVVAAATAVIEAGNGRFYTWRRVTDSIRPVAFRGPDLSAWVELFREHGREGPVGKGAQRSLGHALGKIVDRPFEVESSRGLLEVILRRPSWLNGGARVWGEPYFELAPAIRPSGHATPPAPAEAPAESRQPRRLAGLPLTEDSSPFAGFLFAAARAAIAAGGSPFVAPAGAPGEDYVGPDIGEWLRYLTSLGYAPPPGLKGTGLQSLTRTFMVHEDRPFTVDCAAGRFSVVLRRVLSPNGLDGRGRVKFKTDGLHLAVVPIIAAAAQAG